MAKDTSELQLTARDLKPAPKCGYPFPKEARLLRNSPIKIRIHVAHFNACLVSVWIGDIVPSAKDICTSGVLEQLDGLCDVRAFAEEQNPRVRALAQE